jgi:hypothetical protein
LASFYDRGDAARKLVAVGATVNARDALLQTPMHVAAKQGHHLMVRLLKSAGADLSLRDRAGHTAAYYCSQTEALRAELNDAALPHLMRLAAVRDADELAACCAIVMQVSMCPSCVNFDVQSVVVSLMSCGCGARVARPRSCVRLCGTLPLHPAAESVVVCAVSLRVCVCVLFVSTTTAHPVWRRVLHAVRGH